MYVKLGQLGITQQQLATTQAAAGAAAGVASAIPAAAGASLGTIAGVSMTIPIVGGIVAGVAGLAALFHLGQGCGQACVSAATAEQVYEWASDMVKKALDAGMLTGQQAYQAGQWLIQQAKANMSGGDSHMAAGLNNAIKVINNELPASLATSHPTQTTPLDPTRLASMFPKSKSGWYNVSVTDGNSLALQAIGTLPQVQTQINSAQSSGAAPASTSSSGFSKLLLAGGGLAAAYLLL